MDNLIRMQVFFSGRVQGVGFRYTTHATAKRFDVVGFVRNLPNGDVELIAESTTAELKAFVAAVQTAMRPNIDGADVHTLVATGEFNDFQIRR